MQSFSYWERASFLVSADYLVIGAGIVGLNAALAIRAAEPHAKIMVLERGSLPTGASTKNAGFACFGSASELLDDLSHQDPETVWGLVARRYEGLRRLRALLGDDNIGYQGSGNYELFADADKELYAQCLEHIIVLNQKMRDITGEADTFEPCQSEIANLGLGNVSQLIRNKAEGQLHTGQLMRRLISLVQSQDIDIYCGVTVEQLIPADSHYTIQTNTLGRLAAKQVIMATNGFAKQLLPDLDVQPARNQVLVTKPIQNLKLKGCFHYDKGYIYFRDLPEGRVLLGGGRNLDIAGETTWAFGTTAAIQQHLYNFLTAYILPGSKAQDVVDYEWSGILGVGPNKTPIIRRIDERLTVAVRMGGMGVALGILAGQDAAQLALNY